MDINEHPIDIESLVIKFMGSSEVTGKINEMLSRGQTRLGINIDSIRDFDEELARQCLQKPIKIFPVFESHLQDLTKELGEDFKNTQKIQPGIQERSTVYCIYFEGTFAKNMVSPRGLTAELTNQYVCVQGITTRISLIRPKLIRSVHYCEETKQGTVKEYSDQFSNNRNNVDGNFAGKGGLYMSDTVPTKDMHGNPLSFEYGLSQFKDYQIVLIQEPPERTPVGQLPRSVEVVLENDLVDKVKPGDRYIVINF
jgi:DNA replication licensing factor MCM3